MWADVLDQYRAWLWVPCVLVPVALLGVNVAWTIPAKIRGIASTCEKHFLWAGLLLGLFLVVRLLRGGNDERQRMRAALFAVLLFSALFHSLSVSRFRWTYDNNPLIVLAHALAIAVLLDWLTSVFCVSTGRRALMVAAVGLVQVGAWACLCAQLAACGECTESWPEVPYLAGARLRPGANGMRELVKMVRELSANPDDAVLLLPSDPNVEAWFARPRPQLSAPILFADQYWDRFVESDLAAIRGQLPKVIVIGPRDYWPEFQSLWQTNYGVTRLIGLIQREVLPAHYHRQAVVPIRYRGGTDAMEVFVRN
jgi:hypothetical protein